MFNWNFKELLSNRINEVRDIFLEINKELNTVTRIILFFSTLPFVSVYVFFIFFTVIIYVIYLLTLIIFYKIVIFLKIRKNIKIFKYEERYLKLKTVYSVFIKNMFFDFIRKNGFFYTYIIIKFFTKKLYKEIKLKKILDIIIALIIRILLIIITGITILILKTNLNFNKIINDILKYSAESKLAYIHNILENISYKANFDLNLNLKGRRILIFKNKIKTNMKGGNKFLGKTINYISDKISKKIKFNKKLKIKEDKFEKDESEYKKELLNKKFLEDSDKTKTDLVKLKLKNKIIFADKENVEKYKNITHSLAKNAEILVCKTTTYEPKPHISGSYKATLKKELVNSWEEFKYEEISRDIKINKKIESDYSLKSDIQSNSQLSNSDWSIKSKTSLNSDFSGESDTEARVLIKETKSTYVKALPEFMKTSYKSKGSINPKLVTNKTKPIIVKPEDIKISEKSSKIVSNEGTKHKMMIESANSLITDYNNNTEYYFGGGDTLIKGKSGFKNLVDNKLENSELTYKIKEGSAVFDSIKVNSSLHNEKLIDMETQKEITAQIVFSIDVAKEIEFENLKNKNINNIYEHFLSKK